VEHPTAGVFAGGDCGWRTRRWEWRWRYLDVDGEGDGEGDVRGVYVGGLEQQRAECDGM
jgi:hypothetical protein